MVQLAALRTKTVPSKQSSSSDDSDDDEPVKTIAKGGKTIDGDRHQRERQVRRLGSTPAQNKAAVPAKSNGSAKKKDSSSSSDSSDDDVKKPLAKSKPAPVVQPPKVDLKRKAAAPSSSSSDSDDVAPPANKKQPTPSKGNSFSFDCVKYSPNHWKVQLLR